MNAKVTCLDAQRIGPIMLRLSLAVRDLIRFTFTAWLAAGLVLAVCSASGQINPTLTNVVDKGVAATLNWGGGTGVFLLQKKLSLTDPAWINVLTTSNRSFTLAKEAQSGFFRLQSVAPNTVLPFTVFMEGASEVPATSSAGSAIGALSLEGSNLNYYISFSGLSGPATAAHIHAPGTPTNTASVLVPLSVPAAPAGTLSGTVVLTQNQITNLVNGIAYINIHTGQNPGGEIRGQIVPLGMVVMLNAASEIPPTTSSATAVGRLTFIGNRLLYQISYSGLAGPGTAAHIHGPAGVTNSASPIVALNTPSGTSGTISGSATLTPLQMAYVLAGQTYINIHTTVNPGGEIRAQIWPLQFGATMNGASEVPATASAGTGSGILTVISNVLSYNFSFANLSSAATAGHIHGPAATTNSGPVLIPFSVPAATSGTFSGTATLTAQQLFYMINGQTYANIHTTTDPNGEIRGQIIPAN